MTAKKAGIWFLAILATGALLNACANIVKPNGGPKDELGPSIEYSDPPNRTVNFDGRSITFRFDEFLKDGNYAKEVFISPFLEEKPEVLVKNKLLTIRFPKLADSTTYVINLGKGIKDFNEGNEMAKPVTFAFSTGPVLDSLYFRGQVINPWTGRPEEDIRLLLFPEDSVRNNGIVEKRPLYLVESDQSGNFSFLFLKGQKYYLYGVKDVDNSYTYNQLNEKIALLKDPLVDVTDSALLERNFELVAFFPDEEPPEVKSVKWLNEKTLHLEFKEKIRTEFEQQQLEIFISDTSGGNRQLLTGRQFLYERPNDLLIAVDWPDSIPADIEIKNMMDTLGNSADSTLRLMPGRKSTLGDGKLFFKPKLSLELQAVILETTIPVDSFAGWDTLMALRDTIDERLNMGVDFHSPFRILIHPRMQPDPKMPYQIIIREGFHFRDSVLRDTVLEFPMKFPLHDQFGSITGKIIPDSTDPADMQYIVLLVSSGGKTSGKVIRRTRGERNFKFDWISPEKYQIIVLKDRDKNGYWSPGDLDPYTLPEEIYIDPEQLEIRANWDIEDYTVHPVKKASTKGKKGGKGKGSDDPDEEKEDK